MTTQKLGLPLITGNMTPNIPRDINALAEAVDAKVATASDVGDRTSLLTTNKTSLVAAINEAFQFGNSRKSELVDKLLLLDPSLPINYASTWQEILTATGTVKTGKQYASGTATSSGTTMAFQYAGNTATHSLYHITVTGLPFKPSLIIVTQYNGPGAIFETIYSEDNNTVYPKEIRVSGMYTPTTVGNNATYTFKGDVSPAVVDENHFVLPARQANLPCEWRIWGE